MPKNKITIRPADESDVSLIRSLIQGLAEYEKLAHEMVATEADLRSTLFGEKPAAEVVIASFDGRPAGFALFFSSYSTFLGKPGLYLEDLFVQPELRGKGIGKKLLIHLAKIAVDRDYGRFEWSVLDWNTPAIDFYESLGAKPMEGWTVYRVAGEALSKLAQTYNDKQ